MVGFRSRGLAIWAAPALVLLAQAFAFTPLEAQRASAHQGLVARFAYSDRNRPDCFWGDSMVLTVREGRGRFYSRNMCSAYSIGNARTMRDARGRAYVIVELGRGHGTHATSHFLNIFSLAGGLHERGCFSIIEPMGIGLNSVFSYRVITPPRGGLRFTGRWIVEGVAQPGDRVPGPHVATYDFDTSPHLGRAVPRSCPDEE